MSTYVHAFQYCMDILNAVMYYLGYNAIYVFSVCQLFYEKMHALTKSPKLECIKNKFRVFTSNAYHEQTEDRPKYFIECFNTDPTDNTMNKTEMHYDPNDYAQEKDLIEECNGRLLLNDDTYIIYNAPTINGAHDKMIMRDQLFKNVSWENNKIIYKRTTYEFMSVQLKFINDPDNVVHNVSLKTNEYNFYIEGNVINHDFIIYYCNEILKLEELMCTLMKSVEQQSLALSYTLTIVDADVNVLNITDEQDIILGETAYTCV